MALSHQKLAFIVDFIAACRSVEDDAGLEVLLVRLRAQIGSTTAWTGTCGSDVASTVTSVSSDAGILAPTAVIAGCQPTRNAVPESTVDGVRSCQSDAVGGSACLFMDVPPEDSGRELLAHVVPHLLDAVSRVAARPSPASIPALTAREEQVLRWLAEGKSNWAIGQILGISERTVKYHLANIYAKLGVSTRTQAAALAMSHLRL